MPEATTSITVSLPPDLAERVDEAMKQQDQSRSEFLEEAVLRYVVACEWRRLRRYGEARAREQGIKPEDVMRLIEEHRAETGTA